MPFSPRYSRYLTRLEQLGNENARLQKDLDLLTQMRTALEAILLVCRAATATSSAASPFGDLQRIEQLAEQGLRYVEGRKR